MSLGSPKRLRRSASFRSPRSTVTMIAWYPAVSARSTSARARPRSLGTYSWYHSGPSVAWATSSMLWQALLLTAQIVPAARAARAAARAPSGWYSFNPATGASSTGSAMRRPSTVVERSASPTPCSTGGNTPIRRNAAVFSSSVTPSSEPVEMYSKTALGSLRRASCSKSVTQTGSPCLPCVAASASAGSSADSSADSSAGSSVGG